MQLYFMVLIVTLDKLLKQIKGGRWANFSASSVSECASPAITVFRKLPGPHAGNGEEIQRFKDNREKIKTF